MSNIRRYNASFVITGNRIYIYEQSVNAEGTVYKHTTDSKAKHFTDDLLWSDFHYACEDTCKCTNERKLGRTPRNAVLATIHRFKGAVRRKLKQSIKALFIGKLKQTDATTPVPECDMMRNHNTMYIASKSPTQSEHFRSRKQRINHQKAHMLYHTIPSPLRESYELYTEQHNICTEACLDLQACCCEKVEELTYTATLRWPDGSLTVSTPKESHEKALGELMARFAVTCGLCSGMSFGKHRPRRRLRSYGELAATYISEKCFHTALY